MAVSDDALKDLNTKDWFKVDHFFYIRESSRYFLALKENHFDFIITLFYKQHMLMRLICSVSCIYDHFYSISVHRFVYDDVASVVFKVCEFLIMLAF